MLEGRMMGEERERGNQLKELEHRNGASKDGHKGEREQGGGGCGGRGEGEGGGVTMPKNARLEYAGSQAVIVYTANMVIKW
jgi:hypothetical protein